MATMKPKSRKRKLKNLSVDEFMSHGFDSDIESAGSEDVDEDIKEKIPKKQKKKTTKRKRKLSDLSVDEFLRHGLDSDVQSEDTDNEESSTAKLTQEKTIPKESAKTSKHKEQLEKLKEKDPTFYQFLLENDKELLDFDASDDSNDEEEYDSNKNDENLGDEESTTKEETTTSETKETTLREKKQKNISKDHIKKWKQELEENSISTLETVVRTFHLAVRDLTGEDDKGEEGDGEDENEDEEEKLGSNKVLSYTATTDFNALMQLCLKGIFPALENTLKRKQKQKPGKRLPLPSTQTKWSAVKKTVNVYLKDLVQVLRQMSEPHLLVVVLKHTQDLCPYFACFPQVLKMFLKRLVRMWSAGEEHVSVIAFLNVRKCMLFAPKLFEFTLKKMYLAFVKNCKFVTPKTWPTQVFFQNSLVELFSFDLETTYQHGFMYIRQMAIHLRNAIMDKKKESFKAIYNWQFISCLRLWTRVVAELHCEILAPLVYPVVQISIGVIRLLPTMKYYPLRFSCLRSLNSLAEKTDTFIPLAPLILEILESREFNKKSKASTSKPPNINYLLKVAKGDLDTNAYKDIVIDNVCDILLEYFTIYSSSIAFPELIFPACHRMRKYNKTCRTPKYTKQIKQVVDKLEEAGKQMQQKRSLVSFSPKDVDEVKKWEKNISLQGNPLKTYFQTWKILRNALISAQEKKAQADDDNDTDDDRKEKRKRSSKKRKKDLAAKKRESAPKQDKTMPFETEDDILEDFVLSDSDQ